MLSLLKRNFSLLSLLPLVLLSVSCATYQNKISEPRKLIKAGQVSAALPKLKELAENPSDDQLVFLLEYGTALQIAGQYAESNTIFLKADKLADINDFHSVSNIVGATLGSETMIQYKGESYEKVLINAMLAINYLMLNKPDDALVEAKRLNEKLSTMRIEGRKPYELNPFAKYLSALIWESDRKFDDAYIEFEQAYKLDGSNSFLPADLVRSAKNARREDAYRKWKSEFAQVKEDPTWYDRNLGEIVIIYQQGWGPEKQMDPGNHRFPRLYRRFSETQNLAVEIQDATGGKEESRAKEVYNVSQVAIQTLNDDYGALIARRLGGQVAKAVAADQIRQKDELLGAIAWIAMNVSDQADLRQWSFLPETIQMVRIRTKPGDYHLNFKGLDSSGNPTADQGSADLKVVAGKKTFFNFRSLR